MDNEKIQCECKNICMCKKDYSWNSSICICKKGKHLKIIGDNSKIACDEIIYVINIVSTKMTNTIATNVSINSDDKKVRYKIDYYILQTVLLVITLLLSTITYYHYAKHRSKQNAFTH